MNNYSPHMHKYANPSTPETSSNPTGDQPGIARAPAKKVAIVGIRGYSGLELARILMKHPAAELVAGYATEGGIALGDYLPGAQAKKISIQPISALTAEGSAPHGLHTVFLATPAEVSARLAPQLLARGVHVVDLSGAYRFQEGGPQVAAERYGKWYGHGHDSTELLGRAVYGLQPWASANSKGASVGSEAQLVANPGCYATAALMGLIPLLRSRCIDPSFIAIDGKSGATGAGRKAAENLLFTEVDGECLPYRVGFHQHLPEIEEHAFAFSGVRIEPSFATHLLPVRTGLACAIQTRLKPGLGLDAVHAAYSEAYADYPLADFGSLEEKGASLRLLSFKRVVGSARIQIGYSVSGRNLYVFSTIDNLMKGAASQAVENFNCLIGLPLQVGLDPCFESAPLESEVEPEGVTKK